jgi:predicted metal-binding membrane protein
VRSDESVTAPLLLVYIFAGGYALAWCGFSLPATFAQWALAQATLLTPMMRLHSAVFCAVLLVLAGAYQWAPIKRGCLSQCRSPVAFFAAHWRTGVASALRLGFRHGLYCLGCCWALMLLLFVGGVMSLGWITALTLVVLLEKLAPFGVRAGRLGGAMLILAGLVLVWRTR